MTSSAGTSGVADGVVFSGDAAADFPPFAPFLGGASLGPCPRVVK